MHMQASEMAKEAVPFDKIQERLARKGNGKGIDYYLEISKKLGRSIYEVLCEIEKAIDYNELAAVFSECSGVELSLEIKGEVLQNNRHFIETTHGIYIWHYASLDAIARNGKRVYITSKTTFDVYTTSGTLQIDNVSLDSTKEWFTQRVLIPAIKINATDIHIAPRETSGTYKVYFRVLGDIKDIMTLSRLQGNAVTRFLLYWAKEFSPSIRIDDNHRPQDGRIEITKEQGIVPLDMRLSFIPKPNMNDRDLVIRLLYKIELTGSTLHGLGFLSRHEKLMSDMSLKNKGMVLVTGSCGTGKSRTINTILSKIGLSRSVFTVEDPIDYLLSNARQFQTFEWENSDEKNSSVDFSDFARAFKRHDPNVIFIGELRDKVTAEAAFHLSKTGHLVFATLHASKATMIPEMLFHDYDISVDEIADNLMMATNQVLVKRICPKCSVKRTFSEVPEWFSLLSYQNKDEAVKRLMGKQLRVSSSAEQKSVCSCTIRYENSSISTGYIGRTVLAECIPFSPQMFEDGNISVISMDKKTAQSGNILDDAVDKIISGMIDVDALWRLI